MTPRRWLTVGGFALLAVSLVRTAWLSDDAYITFRTADNLVHGYGPVWNTDERVQAFTHLPVILLAPFAIPRSRWRDDWPLIIGPLLVAIYILRIGGDFMMGRFFTAPLVWSAGLLAASPLLTRPRAAALVAAACVVLGLLAPWEPALLSGYGYSRVNNLFHGVPGQEPLDGTSNISVNNVMDERRYYYESSGFLKGRRDQQRPDSALVDDGKALRLGGERVVVRDGIGFSGYFAGPAVHIVDTYALSDPFLARLPAQRATRTGHYRRDVPEGYLASLASGRNQIEDPDLAAFYDRLRLVVSGPLWSGERLRAVAGLLLRRYDHLLERYSARNPPS